MLINLPMRPMYRQHFHHQFGGGIDGRGVFRPLWLRRQLHPFLPSHPITRRWNRVKLGLDVSRDGARFHPCFPWMRRWEAPHSPFPESPDRCRHRRTVFGGKRGLPGLKGPMEMRKEGTYVKKRTLQGKEGGMNKKCTSHAGVRHMRKHPMRRLGMKNRPFLSRRVESPKPRHCCNKKDLKTTNMPGFPKMICHRRPEIRSETDHVGRKMAAMSPGRAGVSSSVLRGRRRWLDGWKNSMTSTTRRPEWKQKVPMHGFNSEDLTVKVIDDNIIHIAAEKEFAVGDDDDVREVVTMTRDFHVPPGVDVSSLRVHFKDPGMVILVADRDIKDHSVNSHDEEEYPPCSPEPSTSTGKTGSQRQKPEVDTESMEMDQSLSTRTPQGKQKDKSEDVDADKVIQRVGNMVTSSPVGDAGSSPEINRATPGGEGPPRDNEIERVGQDDHEKTEKKREISKVELEEEHKNIDMQRVTSESGVTGGEKQADIGLAKPNGEIANPDIHMDVVPPSHASSDVQPLSLTFQLIGFDENDVSIKTDGDKLIVQALHEDSSQDFSGSRLYRAVRSLPDGHTVTSLESHMDDAGTLHVTGHVVHKKENSEEENASFKLEEKK